MITLFDLSGKNDLRFSPYCWRVKYLLNFRKITYQTKPTCFTERLNNTFFGDAKLPTIMDDGIKISNSFNIAEHIENKYVDIDQRIINSENKSSLHFINHWSDHFLNTSILERVAYDIISVLDHKDIEYFIESRSKRFGMSPKDFQTYNMNKSENSFNKCCNFLDKILEKQRYLLGDNITYAEMIVFGSFTWGEKVSKNTQIEKKFERLSAWKNELAIRLGH
ncbi:MAG: hypothetical protein CML91_07495 [Rhodobiaceae bacterium]|nr:hypothetical protein [Rhodobiaceae bacterium]